VITDKTTLAEPAAIGSETLERQGIVATLSGGTAVSIYTENRYVSEDLDRWVAAEGIGRDKETIEFYKRVGRRLPA
jgi:hypothetical protein